MYFQHNILLISWFSWKINIYLENHYVKKEAEKIQQNYSSNNFFFYLFITHNVKLKKDIWWNKNQHLTTNIYNFLNPWLGVHVDSIEM